MFKKSIPAYEPSYDELRREWEGDPNNRPLPPVEGKREALTYPTRVFGRRQAAK